MSDRDIIDAEFEIVGGPAFPLPAWGARHPTQEGFRFYGLFGQGGAPLYQERGLMAWQREPRLLLIGMALVVCLYIIATQVISAVAQEVPSHSGRPTIPPAAVRHLAAAASAGRQ